MEEPTDQEGEQQAGETGGEQQSKPPIDAASLLRFIEDQEVKASAAREAEKRQTETLIAVKRQGNLGSLIAAIVAICTVGQWITTCANNRETTDQTNKLIGVPLGIWAV